MKRVVAKRKKAGSGAKKNAPRRRSSAKGTTATKTRSARVTRSKTTKTKDASARKVTLKRRSLAGKSPAKRNVTLSKMFGAPIPEALPPEEIDLVAEGAGPQSQLKPAGHVAKRKSAPRRQRLKIPAILLEGDEPDSHTASGPGEKFSLGPETPAAHFSAAATHLPASYGTGRLFLTPRDPHWIYAHWDIPPSVQFRHNARSVDRHLILRMHEGDLESKPVAEIHLHPESRHWFAHVEQAGEQYVADLGYYLPARKWKSLATSAVMSTPRDTVSTDATVEFATVPAEVPFATMLSLLPEGEEKKLPLTQAIQYLRECRLRELPPTPAVTAWTPEQERALAEILSMGQGQPSLRGSQESAGLPGELPFPDWPQDFGPLSLSSPSGEYVSSPLGEAQPGRQFWFKVNAELIIHGSTEPGAKVSIAGKPIALQPDGSFACRFALPDGQYELSVAAVSADGSDERGAELKFFRHTNVCGHVEAQPQDPALRPPTAEAL